MAGGPGSQVVTLAPVEQGLVEDRSAQKLGAADRISNLTARRTGEGLENRPGVAEARVYQLDATIPVPNVVTDEGALFEWDTGAFLLDATLHIFYGDYSIYAICHGLLKNPNAVHDTVAYDARQMVNHPPGRLLTYRLIRPGTTAETAPSIDAADSTMFRGHMILAYPSAGAGQYGMGVFSDDGSVMAGDIAGNLSATSFTLVDRVATPYSANDDPGPYLTTPIDDESNPLKSGFVAAHQNRLFVAGNKRSPRRVWYSNLLDYQGWPSANTFTVEDSQSHITALASAGTFLYVFTETEIFMLADVGIPGSETMIRLTTGVGCVYHTTVQVSGRTVWFLDRAGDLWSVTGQRLTNHGDRRSRAMVLDSMGPRYKLRSYFNSEERRYVLTMGDNGGSGYRMNADPETVCMNRCFEYRVDRDAWFVWEYAVADPPIISGGSAALSSIWDQKVIRDTDGRDKIHGIRTMPVPALLQYRTLGRIWMDRGHSDIDTDVTCAWSSAPVNLYDARSLRGRRLWIFTRETSDKSATVDLVSDDDRVRVNLSAPLKDRSPILDQSFNWSDGTRYRGDKPIKVALGMRDGPDDSVNPAIPSTGKHLGVFFKALAADSGNNVGGVALLGAQIEVDPRARRRE
jgi:hypothetical protein